MSCGYFIDILWEKCGESVYFLNKLPTFSMSTNWKPAPKSQVSKTSRQPLYTTKLIRSGGGAVDKRSRRPNQPQQQPQQQQLQRGSPHKRSRNPLESAAQRRMSEADVRDAEVSGRIGRSRNLNLAGNFKFQIILCS